LRGRVRERAMPKWRLTTRMRTHARSLRREQTDAERIIWFALRANRLAGVKFRRQIPIGPYIVDFVASEKMLVVEIDGGQHYEAAHEVRDARRDSYLAARGFRVLRFSNHDVMSNRSGVLETIFEAIGQTLSPTLPRKRGREHTESVAR
jgi:very-short-patch-repair endonuclease